MASSYIVAARRTPMGKFLGALSAIPAPSLAAEAIRAALGDCRIDPERVDETILGNVLSAGVGQAPARQAALAAGCSAASAALTINKVCGSGLKAIMLADQAIRLGDAELVAAGGMENMSQAPHLLPGARSGWKFGHRQALDSMLHDGLWCAAEDAAMGSLADETAQQQGISRDDQDAFAAESHHRAAAAADDGKFAAEIVPINIKTRRGDLLVDRDEGPRPETNAKSLASLRPAFDPAGTATAGNASQISDGAAAVLVANEEVANSIDPASDSPLKARIVASAVSGVEPQDLFIAPVSAIEQVLTKAGMTLSDIDLIELNEAFASQALACMRSLKLDSDKVNVHGGAIALGHPIGASGARVLVTLLHAMADRDVSRGLVSLCLGGGNAVAMIVERV